MSLAKILITAAVTFLALSAAAQDKALIGTWEGWLVNGDGSQTAQRQSRIGEMVITAAQISTKDGRGTSMGAGTYEVGGAGTVKTIDATGTAGQPQGKSFQGIYQISGDTLKWCSGNDKARTRPTELKTNIGNGHFLMILTRKTDAKK
ncbi:MAG: TIGR03067 domain-containing protein [Limisphaerales bacterium]